MAEVFELQTMFALSLLVSLLCFINGVVSQNAGSMLHQNEYLLQMDSLQNGETSLFMENSCNLALYNGNRVVWDTNTAGQATLSCWAQLLINGNLAVFGDNKIIYNRDNGKAIGNYTMTLENGRIYIRRIRGSEIDVFSGSMLNQNEYLLPNTTLRNGNTRLEFTSLCNLVLFQGDRRIWSSNTAGQAQRSCWAQLLINGNFVVIIDNHILWNNNSGGVIGKYILRLETGRFVIERASVNDDLVPVWAPNIVKDPVVEYVEQV